MKISTLAICALAVTALAAGCAGGKSKKAATEAEAATQAAKEQAVADAAALSAKEQAVADSLLQAEKAEQAALKLADLPEEPLFDIITNLGTMTVKLYSKTPKHRENFAKLALSGFYDGLLFHRVINGFMIQGGDPLTKDPANAAKFGTGGPGYTVPAEFVPEYTHKKGALAAARRGDAANPMKESSGSQFYIVQNENACAQLDGGYTVFGETVRGLDIIDSIASVPVDGRDRPVSEVKIINIKVHEEIAE